MGQLVCALRKSAPNSALAVLDMTWHMIWHRMWIGPLFGGAGSVAEGGVVGWELKNE